MCVMNLSMSSSVRALDSGSDPDFGLKICLAAVLIHSSY